MNYKSLSTKRTVSLSWSESVQMRMVNWSVDCDSEWAIEVSRKDTHTHARVGVSGGGRISKHTRVYRAFANKVGGTYSLRECWRVAGRCGQWSASVGPPVTRESHKGRFTPASCIYYAYSTFIHRFSLSSFGSCPLCYLLLFFFSTFLYAFISRMYIFCACAPPLPLYVTLDTREIQMRAIYAHTLLILVCVCVQREIQHCATGPHDTASWDPTRNARFFFLFL